MRHFPSIFSTKAVFPFIASSSRACIAAENINGTAPSLSLLQAIAKITQSLRPPASSALRASPPPFSQTYRHYSSFSPPTGGAFN